MKLRRVCVFALALVAAASIRAQGVDIPNRRGSFTPGELSLLPPYCKDMHGMPGHQGPAGDMWRSKIGEEFQHIHHYCRGLRDVFFAKTAPVSSQQRRFLWERSINEFDYMIRNSRVSMPLMPEIHVQRGQSLLQLGRLGEAQAAFQNAREIKRDYWPAYTIWADELVKLKEFKNARSLLEEGLVHLPAQPELQSRIERIKAQDATR